MKRVVFFIGCLSVLTLSVNAIELSAGLGADVGGFFTTTVTDAPEPTKTTLKDTFDKRDLTRWGISAFFDAQYVEANLGLKFLTTSGTGYEATDNFFNLGLKFKYPFQIAERFKLFPLVGFDYSIYTSGKAKQQSIGSSSVELSFERNEFVPTDLHDRFSAILGIGGDFSVIQNQGIIKDIFVRGELNYLYLLNTRGQKNIIDSYDTRGYKLLIFQHGPVFKLAMGFRFM